MFENGDLIDWVVLARLMDPCNVIAIVTLSVLFSDHAISGLNCQAENGDCCIELRHA
jgi:hypothetical protein